MYGIVLYRGVYFGFYDSFRPMASNHFFSRFMLGYGVSLLAGLIAYPLSTISRRLILDAGNTSLKYSSVLQCARSIMKEKGIRGMWAGAGVNILHGITGSLSLILYDAVFRPIFYRK